MIDFFPLLRPLIHCLPPEMAHTMGICCLRMGLYPGANVPPDASLATHVAGLSFPSPVGLAAGFDKNAVAIDGLLRQGFGFVEAGTVTPKAQPGNPKPRIFRLHEDEAVINRLGFNNAGLAAYLRHFAARSRSLGIAGANIGKNKDSADAVADYVTGLEAVYPHADYVTVNISSPNTQGLRALQEKQALDGLLSGLADARSRCITTYGRHVPLFLKVAPDLDMQGRQDIVDAVIAHGLDAIIVGNTTLQRPASLKSKCRSEQGGLSGRPLFDIANDNLRHFYRLSAGRIPLIGVGGIASPQDAYVKIRAGASLVQLYTALVYQGFGLVRRINDGLAMYLKRDGFSSVTQAVGSAAD